MKEELISFKTAKLAKEKGFYILTTYSYWIDLEELKLTDITPHYDFPEEAQKYKKFERYMAPTQSLLQKWLREEKRIYIGVGFGRSAGSMKYKFYATYSDINLSEEDRELITTVWFKSYEEALEQGLLAALKLIK